MVERRRIRDPIHNLIRFSLDKKEDEILWKLIDTPAFQRLRHIKQLGFSDFVYPGATHSRFSHSLGVMEMARKMLNALERNQPEILSIQNYKNKRCATLCAVLLHDIGHGPFSHVFEEISERFGVREKHEAFTLAFIKEGPIRRILQSNDLLDLVVSFFDKPAETHSIFQSIVSDQIDADRLDFLQRDKYFSGIRFGSIDVDWILDSIRYLDTPFEDENEEGVFTSLCFEEKGVRAISEYFSSYVKIYIDVYFHKTTRSVQHLFTEAIMAIISDKSDLQELGIHSLIFEFFDEESIPKRREIYSNLVDGTFVQLIGRVARDGSGEAKELSKRFINRKIYKCLEFSEKQRELWPSPTIENFERELNNQNLHFVKDEIPKKGHKQYSPGDQNYLKNIQIGPDSEGSIYAITKYSDEILGYKGHSPLRYYFLSKRDKEAADRIFRSLPGTSN